MAAKNTGEADVALKKRCKNVLGRKLKNLAGAKMEGIYGLTDIELAAFRIYCGTWPEMAAHIGYQGVGGNLNTYWTQRGIKGKAACYKLLEEDVPAFDMSINTRRTKPEKPDPETGLEGSLAGPLHRLLKQRNRHYTLEQLSTRFDRSVATIRKSLEQIKEAGFVVHVDKGGDNASASILTTATAVISDYDLPGHNLSTVRFGAISDTHLENLSCARAELEWTYDWFLEKGVTAVLHSGDLSDGPGNKGYPGHDLEVQPGLQLQWECAKYIIDEYPRREGMKTYFIESSKSHAGWCFARTGFSMGDAVTRGFVYPSLGPVGEERLWVPGREDMVYLGADEENVWVGPEYRTKISLLHPDGGSSYAVSYQVQKWAESLEGGTKPHLALIGHYHKSNYFTPRNIHVICPGTLCWQTPFMRRKRLSAGVAAWMVEMDVADDGTIHELRPIPHAFYPPERKKTVRLDLPTT